MENNIEYAPNIGIKKSDWMSKVEKKQRFQMIHDLIFEIKLFFVTLKQKKK